MNFKTFANIITKQFESMCKKAPLYLVNLDKDALYEAYQTFFPQGSNDIFRTRQGHDCGQCKNFIRGIGPVVIINEDNTLTSVWDVDADDAVYGVVAKKMSHYVKTKVIEEQAKKKEAAERASKKEKIMELIAKKQDAALESKTMEELQAELAAL
jgi:hypothetical protein